MTLPVPPAPHTPLPPPPGAAWTGPSARPRPPRWLGIGLLARLTGRELRTRTAATGIGVAAGLVAGAALGGALGAGHEDAVQQAAAIALLAGGAALADTTDPRQRDDAAVLLRLGCPRLTVRIAAWAGSVVALGIPAAIAALITHVVRSSMPDADLSPPVPNMAGLALLLVAAGAATTCGTRLTERRDASSASTVWRVLRAVGSVVLILMGALFPSTSNSGTTLDFTLAVGLFFILVGLVGLAPELTASTVAVTRRLPSASWRVSAATLAPQRRGLTLTVSLVAALAALLVLQVTVGTGLGEREEKRVAALRSLGPATWAGNDRVLVVSQGMARTFAFDESTVGPSGETPEPLEGSIPPGTQVAAVQTLDAEAVAAGGALGNTSRSVDGPFGEDWGSVALATPELLAALGLDPRLAGGDRAVVLDRRVLLPDDRVRIVTANNPDAIGENGLALGRGVTRPAVALTDDAAWVGLPSVLLPQQVYDDLPASIRRPRPGDFEIEPFDRVVRYAARPTDRQIGDLYRAFPESEIHRGDERVDLAHRNRTDKTSIVWVRDPADVRELAVGLGTMAIVAVGIALASLRLAVRREEAVLEVLGARRRSRVAVSAARGASIAAAGTAAGALIAVVATRWGVHWYDTRTRFDSLVVLDPIGWSFPTSGLLALAALPVLAGLIGAVLGLLGPGRTSGPDRASH